MNQIHPLAVVDPEAKLGDGNIIGPFCVIDKNVVIGDNNKFLNNVTIHYGARIGNGNEFFPGASISTEPQDLNSKVKIPLVKLVTTIRSVRMLPSVVVQRQRVRPLLETVIC